MKRQARSVPPTRQAPETILADFLDKGWGNIRRDRFWQRIELLATPQNLLALAIALYAWFFVSHVGLRHDRFGSFDYDLGIWDQYVWLMSKGQSFNTIRGMHNFGFHASYAMIVFVPFYWLGAGPWLLNSAMVLSVALGAIPVFRLARRLLDDEVMALALALSYLANFSLQWQLHETFHPETLAVGPLLFAYEAGRAGRWRQYGVLLVFAVLLKEDIALAAAMMGVVFALTGQRLKGWLTFVLSFAWFLLAAKLIIPHYAQSLFYQEFYNDIGSGFGGYADTAVTNPTEYWRAFDRAEGTSYVRDLLAGYGLVSLLSPVHLLIGLPQICANLLSSVSNSWGVRAHYAAVLAVANTIAMVHGVAASKRPTVQRILTVWVLIAAIASGTVWGINRFSPQYRQGFWPLVASEEISNLDEAVRLIPDDAAVAASYLISPHLTHRSHIYTFPNPWQESNWGIGGREEHDPDAVDFIIIDTRVTSADAQQLFSSIVEPTDPQADRWRLVQVGETVFAAERQR